MVRLPMSITTVDSRARTSPALATVSANPSALMSAATTWPPSARIRNTHAWPMPEPPPVIKHAPLRHNVRGWATVGVDTDTAQLLVEVDERSRRIDRTLRSRPTGLRRVMVPGGWDALCRQIMPGCHRSGVSVPTGRLGGSTEPVVEVFGRW